MGKSVLIVCTSHSKLGSTDDKTGTWAEEVMAPYNAWKAAGLDITIASMRGGEIPVDAMSLSDDFKTDDVKAFYDSEESMQKFTNSVPLSEAAAKSFDAIFIPGGHGVVYEMPDNAELQTLLAKYCEEGKVVSSVCHGPAALANVKLSTGKYLVDGKKVTGFTNAEEEAVGKTAVVPFLLESRLKENGGDFSCGPDWSVHTVRDGNLITGQNPQSSKEVAELVIAALG